MEHLDRRQALKFVATALILGPSLSPDARAPTATRAAGLTFEVYRSSGRFRWRLRAANGRIVASGQAYTTKASCLEAIELIQLEAANAAVEDQT
jgi:uncharacterized protein YegP (UPF0339 family)